jgi:hypothetical protein
MLLDCRLDMHLLSACLPACLLSAGASLQVVAYNKMDVPDSSDYWEDVREQLAAAGVPQDSFYAIR